MNKKIVLILTIIGFVACVKVIGLDKYLTFEYIKTNQEVFQSYYLSNKLLTISAFFLIYIITTTLSIPGATILTLLGGGLFGFGLGLLIISFASTIGATFAFLISRSLLKDYVQDKYASRLKSINDGFEKDGAFYLFTLRLVPVVPFFLINLTMGLTKIKLLPYFFVSQLGMLLGTAVFVNAGVRLGELESLSGILSPVLIGSFTLLGVFPIIVKKTLEYLK